MFSNDWASSCLYQGSLLLLAFVFPFFLSDGAGPAARYDTCYRVGVMV